MCIFCKLLDKKKFLPYNNSIHEFIPCTKGIIIVCNLSCQPCSRHIPLASIQPTIETRIFQEVSQHDNGSGLCESQIKARMSSLLHHSDEARRATFLTGSLDVCILPLWKIKSIDHWRLCCGHCQCTMAFVRVCTPPAGDPILLYRFTLCQYYQITIKHTCWARFYRCHSLLCCIMLTWTRARFFSK